MKTDLHKTVSMVRTDPFTNHTDQNMTRWSAQTHPGGQGPNRRKSPIHMSLLRTGRLHLVRCLIVVGPLEAQ